MATVTAIHVPFKKDFEPLVLVEENVAVARGLDRATWQFYRVRYIEPFMEKYELTVPANVVVEVDPVEIELNENELGQIRFSVDNDVEIEVRLPEATAKYSTKRKVHRITRAVIDAYPNLTEITYMADTTPKFKIYNPSSVDVTVTLHVVGFRYVLEPLDEEPERYTVIYVETVPSPGR